MADSNPAGSALPKERKGRGCLYWGCLTVLALFLLAAIGLAVAAYKARSLALEYTEAKPLEMPAPKLSREQVNKVKQRLYSFMAAMEQGRPAGSLTLTDDEINGLIAFDPSFRALSGRARVHFHKGRLTGVVSIPLNHMPFGFADGRYLNGSATFNVGLENGVLLVTLDSLTVHGKPLHQSIMRMLSTRNLAADFYKNPKNARFLARIRCLRIGTGKAVIETMRALPAGRPKVGNRPGAGPGL